MAEDQDPNPQSHHLRRQEKEVEEGGEEEEEEPSSQSRPSKVPRVSSESGGVTMAVASPLGLGLGLGLGEGGGETKTTGFTFMQMQEYHHQDLIFKHMVAGVPVPIHLILPIWKSVAASFGPHHYPSFAGLGNLCYDFRNSMEPEPGRCRRTDGKKWRCSRDVVPEQKYCERHMHRGRNRSRKPVEGAGTTAAIVTTDPSNTALDGDGLAHEGNGDGNGSNNSSSSGSNVNNSGNVVTAARIGSSPISVLSSSTCKTGAS